MEFVRIFAWTSVLVVMTLDTSLAGTTSVSPPTTSTVTSRHGGMQKFTASLFLSGSRVVPSTTEAITHVENSTFSSIPSNKSSISPSMLPSQVWNTSILCRHLAQLANQTALNRPIAADNAVDEPIEAKCFPGFVCINGVCTGAMSCKCYDGWAGLFCQAPCPKDCAPGGTCVTSTSNQAICICNATSKYMPGQGCVELPPEYFTTTTPAPVTTPANLRPLVERECLGAFTCLYGYCQVSSLQCSCDPGWKGQLCDQPCELNCSGHGRCRESSEYVLYCMCDPAYSGESCEIAINFESVGATDNSTRAKTAKVDMSAWYGESSEGSKNLVLTSNHSASHNLTRIDDNSTDTNITTKPLSERDCQPGLVCQHGYCVKGQRLCSCDAGWGGSLCNVSCSLLCANNGTCIVQDDGESPHCECADGFAGAHCEKNETAEQFNPTTREPVVTFSNELHENDPWKDLENGSLAPFVQRLCHPGFVCAYGTCSKLREGFAECLCQPGFTDKFCQTPCPLECTDHSHCDINPVSKAQECYCDKGYAGTNCTEAADGETSAGPMSTTGTASLATVLLLLLLLVFVLVPFVLYKKHNIMMMQIISRFQPLEKEDDMENDAFILYVSTDQDRQFVVQTLIPKLEGQMCFTLCIHQRNFVSGLFNGNSIAESVKRSRRILIIVSPAFISCDWQKPEYQQMFKEMLKRRERIRCIFLGDINGDRNKMNNSLKHILKAGMLLKYPGKSSAEKQFDKFWKRLELSMPKKRSNQLESGKDPSCLISPSIQSAPLEMPKGTNTQLDFHKFTSGKLNSQLLQRIIRVPASKLEESGRSPVATCPAFDRILRRSHSDDSQDGNYGPSTVDAYHRLRHSDSSFPGSAQEGIPNPGLNYSETGQRDSLQTAFGHNYLNGQDTGRH